MRRPFLSLLVVTLATAAASAQTTRPAALRTTPREMNFDQVALTDVIDVFRDATRLNFVVDWKALQEAGVDRNTPVSLRLRAVSVRTALKTALDAAAPGLLAFYVDDNIVHVTTQAVADSRMVTRVFAVGDLLMDIPDSQGPTLSLDTGHSGGSRTAGSGGGSGGGSSGSGSLFGNSSTATAAPAKTTAAKAEDLVALIQTTIRPEVWDVNGGQARIRYSTGRLIVTAPVSVQEQIGGR